MFTDLVGYTALTQKNEALAMQLLEEHRKLVRPLFPKHNGREIKTIGDAFLVEFASALEATRCAFDIQQSLNELNSGRSQDRSVMLRIGIHLGDVIHAENDVYGDAVNIASRIEPLASPGGICVSQQVYDQIKNKFEFPLSTLGERNLKNVSEPVEVYRVVLPWERKTESELSLEKSRIAVLPFANMSPDPADEYFADGMTEELISTMSKISGLRVIARTSVMGYKKGEKKIGEIARELNVGTILEGSVRKAGEKLRITVQLIDSSNEEHLRAQNYDRRLEDVFAIQTEVAEKVADSLKTQLLDEEKEKIEKKPTENIGAYTSYLKGRYHWNKRNRESLEKGLRYFEEAIQRDPNFALAYSGIADSYSILVEEGRINRSESLVKANEAAAKALELDDNLAEAHTSLAGLLDNEWEWIKAEEEFAKALRVNPNYATAHHWYSLYLYDLGRLDEAIKELKIAEELDPLSPIIHACGANHYLAARNYELATEEVDKALELDPNFAPGHYHRVWVYLAKSMFKEAMAELERTVPLFEPLSTSSKAWIGAAYAIAGRTQEAKQFLRECEGASAHERAEENTPHGTWALAIMHLKLGSKDQAFECFEKAFEARTLSPFAKLWAFLDELTSDPRFDELVRKSGAYERLPRHSRIKKAPMSFNCSRENTSARNLA
jgi:TolB-like protein/lipoprotein NlpI